MAFNPALYDHIIKIKPKYAVSYFRKKFPSEPAHRFIPMRKKKDKYSLSRQAKINMNNCFDWLRIISNRKEVYSKKEKKKMWFELTFITLTLPGVQMHSDEHIKKHMLSPFLKWMQRSWTCNSYIWKAEVQNNGRIHFHITTNKFIHWKSIRAKWNRICSAYGYCKVYQDGTNDKGDSATSVEAVYNTGKIQNYVANYCTKKDLFKSKVDAKSKKKVFVASDNCELNNEYYMKDNFRQIECTDGTVREYKRKVSGRLWNASYNLNVQAAWLSQIHEPYNEVIQMLNNTSIVDTLHKDYASIHIFKDKIFKHLPDDVKRVFIEARTELRKEDQPQKQLVIDTFY